MEQTSNENCNGHQKNYNLFFIPGRLKKLA